MRQEHRDGRIDYNPIAAEYAKHRRVHPEVLRKLLGAVGPDRTKPVLEIGCGSGNYIAAVQSATGSPCFGIDPHENMLAAAKVQNPTVTFGVGRGEQLPFDGDAFGLAFSVDVIHHVASLSDYYREAGRVLGAGGTICTVTETEEMIRGRLHSRYFPDVVTVELRRYPAVPRLMAEMRQAGFVDVRAEAVECSFQVTDIQPYRDKAFSSLHYISDDAFRHGIEEMERELAGGPLRAVSGAALVWGRKRA